jgi:hypothetical protein
MAPAGLMVNGMRKLLTKRRDLALWGSTPPQRDHTYRPPEPPVHSDFYGSLIEEWNSSH